MSQTLTKPILLDETGVAIKTALNNINDTESQDWLLTYEDVHSEMDDNISRIADGIESIRNILLIDSDLHHIPSWSTGSDSDIYKALELHYKGAIDIREYWSVGEEREVLLKGNDGEHDINYTATLVLSNVGGKKLEDETTDCAFQVDFKDFYPYKMAFDSNESVDGGWKNCELRTFLNTTLPTLIHPVLRPIFKKFYNYVNVYEDAESPKIHLDTTLDTFALRAYSEVVDEEYAYDINYYHPSGFDEGEQVTYYKTSSNQVKKEGAYQWWTRSFYYDSNDTAKALKNYLIVNPPNRQLGSKLTVTRVVSPFCVI